MLDRIDLQIDVPAVPPATLAQAPDGEPRVDVAQRVAQARERQMSRQGCLNAGLSGAALDEHCALGSEASEFFQSTCIRLGWSARGFQRVLRIARSVADLQHMDAIGIAHLAEAIQYRRVLKTR